MSAQAKLQQTSTKGQFTRLENLLRDRLALKPDASSVEIIISMLDDLKAALKGVNVKHDLYVEAEQDVEEEDGNTEHEIWISEIEKRFYTIQQECNVFKKKAEEKILREDSRKDRDVAYKNFRHACLNVQKFMVRDDVSMETIERERNNICVQYNEVSKVHYEYVLVPGVDAEEDDDFETKLFDEYSKISKDVDDYRLKRNPDIKPSVPSRSPASTSGTNKNLHLEKIPLPKFTGDIRLYS